MSKDPKLNKGGGTLSLLSSTNSQKTKINGKWSIQSYIRSANGICGSKHRQVNFTSENFRENFFKPLFMAQTPVYNFSWKFKVDPENVSKKVKYRVIWSKLRFFSLTAHSQKWLFGLKLRIFINLGLWIYITLRGIAFL